MVAALLHYFLLVAFSWMLIEGLFLHILIVKVFHDHLPKKRYYVAFCWGLPLLIVLLSVNLLRDGYGTKT
ncbi:adhesion G- coupled receptor D1 isoform X2, partial [Paramuricea clavata]